jgi:hypothetical protein
MLAMPARRRAQRIEDPPLLRPFRRPVTLGQASSLQPVCTSAAPATAATFAKTLGKTVTAGEPRATHRRRRRPYKTRVRMPSKLAAHIAMIEGWLAAQPQLTALAAYLDLNKRLLKPRRSDNEGAS